MVECRLQPSCTRPILKAEAGGKSAQNSETPSQMSSGMMNRLGMGLIGEYVLDTVMMLTALLDL